MWVVVRKHREGSWVGLIEFTSLVAEIGGACKNQFLSEVIKSWSSINLSRKKIERASKEFFLQPTEEKRKVSRDEDKPMGFYDTEHTKNFGLYREACEEYARGIEKLSYKLLELIALSLGLPSERLNSYFKEQTSFMRLNYYPLCPIRHLALGLAGTRILGALTVLAQDATLRPRGETQDRWRMDSVKPTPDAYIVNVGDIIQVWSNDRYESVNIGWQPAPRKRDFLSPFFFSPSHYVMVEPLEELISEESPAKYKAYNWGKEIQHYKKP
ncbi:hypothetical protein HAX54_019126 [Datura stramonium]|uniref:Isopenicillin N synthase-like Fe(2+) 2OG dioxygenase domain-containing protein n=1 Tax=Datura stramonium TaxID=4076 RepID=A0ABS8UNP4_DATST|nr:hypothetical protein [Datura stramonium]